MSLKSLVRPVLTGAVVATVILGTVALPAYADQSTIVVGTQPQDVALIPGQSKAYVTNAGSNTISVVDTDTNTVVKTIVGLRVKPMGIAVTADGTKAYVANYGGNAVVTVIDTATDAVITTVHDSALTDGAPIAVGMRPGASEAWVANYDFAVGAVTVINTTNNTVKASIPVADGPVDVGFSRNGAKAYVASSVAGILTVINTSTLEVLKTIPFASASAVASSPIEDKLYVAGSNVLRVLDTTTDEIDTSIPAITVGASAAQIDFTADGTKAYVASEASGQGVAVIDALTDTRDPVTPLITVGGYANGIAVSPDGTRVYITNGLTLTVVAPPKPFTSAAQVSITGAADNAPVVGGVLHAQIDTDASPTPTSYGYQWYADGAPLVFATNANYTVPVALVGMAITVTVTPTLTGYESTSGAGTSAPTPDVAKASFARTPTPVIIGDSTAVGATLQVTRGIWDLRASLTPQWHADGEAILGAGGTTYVITADTLGKTITVTVTGTASGYNTAAMTSEGVGPVIEGSFGTAADVTITGDASVGQRLTATASGASPMPTGYTYQWFADDELVDGAIGQTFDLTANQLGASITVTATPVLAGYLGGAGTSDETVPVKTGSFTASPDVTITGDAAVGQRLTASATGAAPVPTGYSYQWLVDGDPVSGATEQTFDLTADLLGAAITVTATPSLAGYKSDTGVGTSAASSPVVLGSFTGVPEVTITGDAAVGETLTADIALGATPMPTRYEYQWFAGGAPVDGATEQTFELAAEHLGAAVTVTVTPVLTGYAGGTGTSEETAPVEAGAFTMSPEVAIDGDAAVGKSLTAELTRGADPAPTRYEYQWFADGELVDGATGKTLTVTAELLGATITVTAAPVLVGYASDTGTGTSAASSPVVLGSFSDTPEVTIAGDAAVGQQLSVSAAGASPTPSGYEYQWFADGAPVEGATGQTFTLTADLLGTEITVRAVPVLAGYASNTGTGMSDASSPVVLGGFTTSPEVTVTGDAAVGETLDAAVIENASPTPTAYEYQWFADDEPVDGATAQTVTLTADLLGATITVAATPVLAGYASDTGVGTSDASTPVVRGTFTDESVATITGDPAVGETLTAEVTRDATPAPTAYTYQWFADDEPVDGATGQTLELVPGLLGASITLVVTPVLDGFDSATGTTTPIAASAPVALGSFSENAQVTVTGAPVVGKTLTATVTRDAIPEPTDYAYRWFADGEPIEDATGATLTLAAAYVGSTITVEVMPLLDGYEQATGSETSTPTGAVISLALSVSQVIAGHQVTVIASGLTPAATYLLQLHSDPISLGSATADENGDIRAVVTIPLTTASGEHEIALLDADGVQLASESLAVTAPAPAVDAQPSPEAGGLAETGLDPSWPLIGSSMLLLALGAALLGVRRARSNR